ncbi:MAG: hypothetical protein IPH93_12585 [Saprospiraceae bacterium]|nr:hypothetical protein [Saprospiraceae bacterium]MBK7812779.1 hypothetical protein [Saprospiraceae bacterium]MBK9630969.1 hypothetical protein [Saprospiraceae bacterium]
MKYLFWILWSIELGFMLWWLFDEMKLKYLSMNPSVYLGFVWLILALVVKFLVKSDTIAMYMVGIPGALLAIMGLLIGMYIALK